MTFCFQFSGSSISKKRSRSLFDPHSQVFIDFVISCVVIIGMFMVVGFVWQYRKKTKVIKKKGDKMLMFYICI